MSALMGTRSMTHPQHTRAAFPTPDLLPRPLLQHQDHAGKGQFPLHFTPGGIHDFHSGPSLTATAAGELEQEPAERAGIWEESSGTGGFFLT